MSPFLIDEYEEGELEALYAKYGPILEGLTNIEKEDKLIDLVAIGELAADRALKIAIHEGLIIGS